MHRPTHKLPRSLLALLVAVVASQALADGSRSHGSRSYGSQYHGSQNHGSQYHGSQHYGSQHYGSYSNYPRVSHSYHGSYTNYHYNYPSRGYATYQLPYGYRTVNHYGSSYYYHGGSWYRPYGPRFVVVAPPFGIGISVLPPYYSTVWFGSSPYYYADDTYYTYRPERREYVVTEPPRGEAGVESSAAGSDEIFVYPGQGQSEEQQSTDRGQCHQWAVGRTGFDPALPAGNAQTDMTSKRADYRRAEAACLEGRGYTVR